MNIEELKLKMNADRVGEFMAQLHYDHKNPGRYVDRWYQTFYCYNQIAVQIDRVDSNSNCGVYFIYKTTPEYHPSKRTMNGRYKIGEAYYGKSEEIQFDDDISESDQIIILSDLFAQSEATRIRDKERLEKASAFWRAWDQKNKEAVDESWTR